MPGNAHERLVLLFAEFPKLLERLLTLADPTNAPVLPAAVDSTVRTERPTEFRPDLMFADANTGYWVGVEVQRRIKAPKETIWPAMIALQNHQRKCAGDLVVITHKADVAAWVHDLPPTVGALGTTLRCAPIVVHVDAAMSELLLESRDPMAAVIAAWSMHDRTNNTAVSIATRAVQTILVPTDSASGELGADQTALRMRLVSAILSFLQQPVSEKVFAFMKDDKDSHQHSIFDDFVADLEAKNLAKGKAEGIAKGKAEGRAEGLREALHAVLKTRGLVPSKKVLAKIDACTDVKKLKLWHARAVSAAKMADVVRE
jgi:hypothetical protein